MIKSEGRLNKVGEKGYSDTSHWSEVTTGEVGSMVREAIKLGEQVIAKEAQENGKAYQNTE